MEKPTGGATTGTTTHGGGPLHTAHLLSIAHFNRMFGLVYVAAILALFYHHTQTLLCSTTLVSFITTLTLFLSDIILAFMWSTAQASRLNPIKRSEFPENLDKVIKRSEYPAVDVFICTADPIKEPPMSVVNTALSVLAYDYPPEKLSVYVSDDGGSALTLFAFMEAAKFAGHWLPFCRDNNVVERSPEAYFDSASSLPHDNQKIKMMYEAMKTKVEKVVEKGAVEEEYICSDDERQVLNQYHTRNFTSQDHPPIIKVLLENKRDKDMCGHFVPNLVYVSREKSKLSHHHFKAGALNALLRVSAAMTNAPIVLMLDCDMNSNHPQTLLRVLCYYHDHEIRSKYAYIQFPQHFQGINKDDVYATQIKRMFIIQPMGFDGIMGPDCFGTGCFFSRRALFGNPSRLILPETVEFRPDHVVDKPMSSPEVLALAYHATSCNYENQTMWGDKIGFRYGSLVEDLFTGYQLHCDGWRSILCNPKRPAFVGNAPICLIDFLNQQKRWVVGVSEVGFSKYSPLTYGLRYLNPLMVLAYSQYILWPIWSIPISIYAFIPQLALLNRVSLFPKVSEPWFVLYPFLFLGAYGQDLLDFVAVGGGTFKMWWNDQRLWVIKGLTCLLFGSVEFLFKSFGLSSLSFNVTSKVTDDEQNERYKKGIFDFGARSPMFVTLAMAALINLVSFVLGLAQAIKESNFDGLLIQMFITGYSVVVSWPVYEAMVLRNDKGKIPTSIIVSAAILTSALCILASLIFK